MKTNFLNAIEAWMCTVWAWIKFQNQGLTISPALLIVLADEFSVPSSDMYLKREIFTYWNTVNGWAEFADCGMF